MAEYKKLVAELFLGIGSAIQAFTNPYLFVIHKKQKLIAVPAMPYTASSISVVFITSITVSHKIFAIIINKPNKMIFLNLFFCISQVKPIPRYTIKLNAKLEI